MFCQIKILIKALRILIILEATILVLYTHLVELELIVHMLIPVGCIYAKEK